MTDKNILKQVLSNTALHRLGIGVVESTTDYLLSKDIKPVKHGEWLQTIEPLGWQDVDCVECSACQYSWICDEDFDFEFCKEQWKYCPNCGAKMDID